MHRFFASDGSRHYPPPTVVGPQPYTCSQKKLDWQSCGNYRVLNRVTVPGQYPILQILHLHYMVPVFSMLDLVHMYYLIPVASDDIHTTAVTTPFGLFKFTYMPFGLRNAAETFLHFMDMVLHGLEFTYTYIDVLVASNDEAEHAPFHSNNYLTVQTVWSLH